MKRVRLIGVLGAVSMVALTSLAFGAKLKNGNFEKGNFSGWTTLSSDAAKWKIYDKQHTVVTPPMKADRLNVGIELPKPIGKYSPFIDMFDQSNGFLSREIKIPGDAKSLTLKAFWHNAAERWTQEGTYTNPGPDDQYFSIDLIKPGASPRTSDEGDVLTNIYAPRKDRGIPEMKVARGNYVNDWKTFKTSVKKYRGEKVVLRVAEISMSAVNYVGIDNVKVK